MAKVFVETNELGQVIGWATSRGSDTEIELDLDDSHPFLAKNQFFFTLKDGVLTEDETRKQDVRQKRKDRKEINDLKQTLADTDFYFIRKMDENTEIPDDVKAKRKAARKRLKELGL